MPFLAIGCWRKSLTFKRVFFHFVSQVLFSLRSIRSFAEYPQRIQQKLVKVGWFETYVSGNLYSKQIIFPIKDFDCIWFIFRHQTKRAILRQGHIPQAFYFVLSGSGQFTLMWSSTFGETLHCYEMKCKTSILKRGLEVGKRKKKKEKNGERVIYPKPESAFHGHPMLTTPSK